MGMHGRAGNGQGRVGAGSTLGGRVPLSSAGQGWDQDQNEERSAAKCSLPPPAAAAPPGLPGGPWPELTAVPSSGDRCECQGPRFIVRVGVPC